MQPPASIDRGPRPDVIVVGSGFGGSIMAARLAERGLNVLILERGPWWGPGAAAAPPVERRPYPRGVLGVRKLVRSVRMSGGERIREKLLNRDGLLDVDRFRNLLVLSSSGVGGGSHVFEGVLSVPETDYFEAFPAEVTAEEMAPYYDAVRNMLRPAKVSAPLLKTEVFARAVRAAGLPDPVPTDLAIAMGADPSRPTTVSNAVGLLQSTSTHQGTCMLGSADGSKATLDRNYLAIALRHGARIRALCEVTMIGRDEDGYQVRWRDHVTGTEHTVSAPRLVLAAGTLATLRLLFAARDVHRTLPALPDSLGEGFSSGGDSIGVIHNSAALQGAETGPVTSYTVVRTADGRIHHAVGEAAPPLNALPLPSFVRKRLARTALLFAMGRDASRGTIWHDGTGLRTDLGRHMDPATFDFIEDTCANIAAGYNARHVFLNAPGGRGDRRLASVHPLGGARVANGPDEGVIDHTGEVFGHPGLYVADSSFFPAAPGLPPSMTVAAFAERAAALFDDKSVAGGTRRRPPRAVRQ